MAKFSRLILGGIFGAGIAYLFSRKDVRQRLLGGGRPQLSAAGETPYGPPAATVTPTAAPADTTVAPAAPAADLESRIEETRRQVQETLGETEAPAQVEEPAVTETAADVAEVPPVEEPVGEAPAEETPVAEPPIEEAAPIAEPEVVEETPRGAGLEALKEESSAVEKQASEESAAAAEAPEPGGAPEIVIEETIEVTEFTDLKTPVAGEPTVGEPAEAEEAGETAEAGRSGSASGPAPSQIDREEMRRRIDETRARLKAKAFDAMVSGETFIEPETSEGGLETKHDADVSIDKDLEEQIDKSLKEQD
ncbi:MAG: hypothetical protein ACYCW5_03390 [Thermoleophilia bacterium]